jgi:predicted acyltransferase (DUF342 family)
MDRYSVTIADFSKGGPAVDDNVVENAAIALRQRGEVRIQFPEDYTPGIPGRQLTVGQTARISGEVVADEVVVNGHVAGRLRGTSVRLSGSARVVGDIIHKTIAFENGAHFEGSVQRQDDPVGDGRSARPIGPSAPAPAREPAKVG